uniref:Uncharacterized protein n=1 Tax=Oryza brachyantha TaxID=4533 RepID=J3NAK6_ORYBR
MAKLGKEKIKNAAASASASAPTARAGVLLQRPAAGEMGTESKDEKQEKIADVPLSGSPLRPAKDKTEENAGEEETAKIKKRAGANNTNIKKQAAAVGRAPGTKNDEKIVGDDETSARGPRPGRRTRPEDALRREARKNAKEDEQMLEQILSSVRARARQQQCVQNLDFLSIGVKAGVRSFHRLMMKRGHLQRALKIFYRDSTTTNKGKTTDPPVYSVDAQ